MSRPSVSAEEAARPLLAILEAVTMAILEQALSPIPLHAIGTALAAAATTMRDGSRPALEAYCEANGLATTSVTGHPAINPRIPLEDAALRQAITLHALATVIQEIQEPRP